MSHILSIQVPCFSVARALYFLIQLRARGCIFYWLLNSVAVILSMFWVYCVTIMIGFIGIGTKAIWVCVCLFLCEVLVIIFVENNVGWEGLTQCRALVGSPRFDALLTPASGCLGLGLQLCSTILCVLASFYVT